MREALCVQSRAGSSRENGGPQRWSPEFWPESTSESSGFLDIGATVTAHGSTAGQAVWGRQASGPGAGTRSWASGRKLTATAPSCGAEAKLREADFGWGFWATRHAGHRLSPVGRLTGSGRPQAAPRRSQAEGVTPLGTSIQRPTRSHLPSSSMVRFSRRSSRISSWTFVAPPRKTKSGGGHVRRAPSAALLSGVRLGVPIRAPPRGARRVFWAVGVCRGFGLFVALAFVLRRSCVSPRPQPGGLRTTCCGARRCPPRSSRWASTGTAGALG